ncbi:MAG: cytoplasmic protein [Alphaproteobacteria bacterium]|nr:cytoplasmic protein [Alphaproteobacteria bacterium]HCP00877.1 DUF1013 domain-containing protein [Rhodospirillaceae bacterium]
MAPPLMPKATAVWLVENTSLSFAQIADFTGMHMLEIQGIADGEVGVGMRGLDPMANGQLESTEIERCQADPAARLVLQETDNPAPVKRTKGPRYVPVSKRQDKPDGIAYLVRYYPELSDAQIGKLIGTTKPTITSIRDRTHWNSSQIQPRDPVTIGLCRQVDLDEAIDKAHKAGRQPAADDRRPISADLIPEEEPAQSRIPDWMADVRIGGNNQGEN